MLLDCMPDISDTITFLALIESNIESLFGDLEKSLHLRRSFATSERVSRVAYIAIELYHAINRNVITFIDEHLIARDTMNNDIINRNTESSRKALIAFAQRDTAIVSDKLLTNFIQVSRSDTGTNMTAHLGESFTDEAGTVTYQFYFFFSL